MAWQAVGCEALLPQAYWWICSLSPKGSGIFNATFLCFRCLSVRYIQAFKMMTTMARNMSAAQPQMRERLHVQKLNTQVGESSLRIPSTSSASSSRHSADELFFDCPSRSASASGSALETSVPSYLVFEPVVESFSDNEPVDWRRFEPPN